MNRIPCVRRLAAVMPAPADQFPVPELGRARDLVRGEGGHDHDCRDRPDAPYRASR
jgi:hypothetical protein